MFHLVWGLGGVGSVFGSTMSAEIFFFFFMFRDEREIWVLVIFQYTASPDSRSCNYRHDLINVNTIKTEFTLRLYSPTFNTMTTIYNYSLEN